MFVKKPWIYIAGTFLITATLVFSGCADLARPGKGAPPSAQQVDPNTGAPYTSSGGIPAAHQQALFTTLSGSMNYQGSQQPFTATLSPQTYQGSTYAFVQFNSTGTIGNFVLSEYLGTGAMGVYDPYSGGYIYTFGTRIMSLQTSWIQTNTVLYFYLVVVPNGATFSISRTRSGIYFLDCGNSQSSCSIFNPVQGLNLVLN